MIIALAKYTGWGLNEMLELTERELTHWFEAAIKYKQDCDQ